MRLEKKANFDNPLKKEEEATVIGRTNCVHHSICRDIGDGRVEEVCIRPGCGRVAIVTPKYLRTQIPVGFAGNFDDSLQHDEREAAKILGGRRL